MLKKCLKHEWKACWKNMALLNGAAIFMGALGGFGFLFSQISELPDLLIVLYLFAYVFDCDRRIRHDTGADDPALL
mgnify:CR=1 FL=1